MNLRDRWLPKSIVARMSLVLFIGILIAQALGGALWSRQIQVGEAQRLEQVATNLGSRIGQTVQFFSRLPDQYRHIVLDQLRDMGGTRFFVSVNPSFIPLNQLPETDITRRAREILSQNLQAQTGVQPTLTVQFVPFDKVRILSNQNLMVDLPMQWQRFALVDPQDQSPVAVVQYELADQQWIYVAAVVPLGESFYGVSWLAPDRLLSLSLVSLTVLILTVFLVRWIVGPLRLLARRADALGRGDAPERIAEQGSREMISTIKAFNSMGQRIHKFIADRERFFASISHDLKTPLTRARLRAEMLEDDTREDLIKDLDDLDVMLKGALQMLKEGAIHENPETIDLGALLGQCVRDAQISGFPSVLDARGDLVIQGRRLALERVFSNLIDNALHYAQGVEIETRRFADRIQIDVMDRGPGIADELKEKVFEPYYRQDRSPNTIHVGLGMGIVRSLVQQQGGSVSLKDRLGGGLIVRVELALSHFDTKRDVA